MNNEEIRALKESHQISFTQLFVELREEFKFLADLYYSHESHTWGTYYHDGEIYEHETFKKVVEKLQHHKSHKYGPHATHLKRLKAEREELEPLEITKQELENLLEYSTTIPTGTTHGKRWKRDLNWGGPGDEKIYIIMEYRTSSEKPGYMDILKYNPIIKTDEKTTN